jgi:hypothetical protein
MRHAEIRTTMNVYGDAATAEMAEAHGKVVGLALNERKHSAERAKRFRSGERGRNRTFNLLFP